MFHIFGITFHSKLVLLKCVKRIKQWHSVKLGKARALFLHCVLLCSLLSSSERCLCFSLPEDSQVLSVLSGLITPSRAVSRRRLADSLPLSY